ncbi:MAG: FkbM family methyltransferase [Planctomycetota bacterium]
MATIVGRQLKRRLAVPYGCYKLATKRGSFIHESGWLESIRTSTPCDQSGSPVPWMNYSVVEFLRERLQPGFRVFEYGSGYSTCFFASLCQTVISVEYDKAWLDRVRQMIPTNARVIHQEKDVDGEYCRTIHQVDGNFDIVLVDGRDRVHCVAQAVSCLTGEGVLLLDDSDRPRYRKAVDQLTQEGFRNLKFSGLKPGNPCRTETTVFYRDHNCLGI